jgi:hypothetical protein
VHCVWRVVVCCGVLWCVVVCCGVLWCVVARCGVLWRVVACCGVLWRVHVGLCVHAKNIVVYLCFVSYFLVA